MVTARTIRNARILTPTRAGMTYVEGYLRSEGQRITAIGAGAAPNAGQVPEEIVDAHGLTIIPGLINCHTHATLTLHRGICDDADLFSWAAKNYPTIRSLTERDFTLANELACFELAHAGITTVVECCRYRPILFAQAATRVGLRSLTGGLAVGQLMGREVTPNWPALIAETELALEQFGDHPLCTFYLGGHSPYNCPPDLLEQVRRTADALTIGLGIHLAETRHEEALIRDAYGMSPTAYLDAHGWLGPGTLAAHAVWPSEDDIDLLARTGTNVAHCPVSNAKLASGVAPVTTLRSRGIAVGLGTDSALSNNRLDLFGEMKTAALLQRVVTDSATALTASDVFRMATLEGARAIGREADLGSLEPGKLADFVMLDLRHPLGLTAERALSDLVWATGPDAVRHVVVDGDWVVRDAQLTQTDEPERRAAIAAEIQKHVVRA
ncbi:MAG: amidohydrolase family protein [Chloroflexota bacterium]